MNDFMKLVKEMREAQTNYFSEKTNFTLKRHWLEKSKILEREVDKAIEKNENPQLFGE